MQNDSILSPKQERVLNFLIKRIGEGLPPTIREIGGELGFNSTGTVRDYLRILEKKGFLKRPNSKSRAIELLKDNPKKIPIIGTIMAGKPDIAYEETQGYIDPHELFLGRLTYEDLFALKVKGDSMIEAGIMDGDTAIIKKRNAADNGSIIAALLDNNEVTLKRLRLKNNRHFLEAANKDYPPIFKDFRILGTLFTIIRKYAAK